MFRVTQQIDFCYGHRLLNYSGKCGQLHGHNGRALIVIEDDQIDERGMVVDFVEIKASIGSWIDSELDHRMILHQNDPVVSVLRELDETLCVIPVNPTAENIARMIYDYGRSQGFAVVEVTLWETPNSSATFKRG